ncbi:MAG: DHH family phosphoesterase [Nitrososphaerota archaeon]|nr:DHH family phosphoesterase [Nitrososphaerota archaeon]MDG6941676.1 DHH family phosphoesterase [Nitrososphaerota archaeon]MDG6951272.1 DHH family phosphoesterase [Nitrososphaerota archaeon]
MNPEEFPFVDPATLRKAVVVCHRNADADAYLSAYAISMLIGTLAPWCETDIATPGGMTTLTQKLSMKFPHRIADGSDGDYDLYVAVDVGDEELLNEWKEKFRVSQGVKVLVDHHPSRGGDLYSYAIIDEEATSAAEVVSGLFERRGVTPDPQTAQALLEAMLFDSSHLAIAGPSGLKAAVKLIDAGADLALARQELRSEPDYGEVIARLKGAQRASIYKAGKWVMATSHIGSFQAHVARALIYLGADLGLVAGESDGETRVSMRATQRFHEATGVKLGSQVAEEMAKRLGGHGGGHATAASFSTTSGEEGTVQATMKRFEELLGELKKLD